MQGTGITVGRGALLLIDEYLHRHPVFRQQKRGQQPDRPGSHHQNFSLIFLRHIMFCLEPYSDNP